MTWIIIGFCLGAILAILWYFASGHVTWELHAMKKYSEWHECMIFKNVAQRGFLPVKPRKYKLFMGDPRFHIWTMLVSIFPHEQVVCDQTKITILKESYRQAMCKRMAGNPNFVGELTDADMDEFLQDFTLELEKKFAGASNKEATGDPLESVQLKDTVVEKDVK